MAKKKAQKKVVAYSFLDEAKKKLPQMAGLWAYLRQIPRPMHSFGHWNGAK